MAFNPSPAMWFGAGYGSSTSAHTITFNTVDAASDKTLPQLTDLAADPTTGDIRTVAFSFADALYQAWSLVASGDRPTKMAISRSSASSPDGTLTYQYHLKFVVSPPSGAYSLQSE